MKGQLSLESLFLLLISISLISISIFALLSIRDYSNHASTLSFFKTSADSISNAISETCLLGSGNSRIVSLQVPISITTDPETKLVRFKNNASSIIKHFSCKVQFASTADTSTSLSGSINVKNSAGLVVMEKVREP